MASISGASRSNTTSSLYNSANVISGLASGLDTEGMIENLVKGLSDQDQHPESEGNQNRVEAGCLPQHYPENGGFQQ